MTVQILTGDCRHTLPQLPSNSIHCIVTSPPYWGARDYGVSADVWGGAADCAHEWQMQTYYLQRHSDDGNGGNLRGSRQNQKQSRMGAATAELCRQCGAWRGVLGMEPLHDCGSWAWGGEPCNICYVCHMRRIFAELWRVLRVDGTLWLNLGDTYYGGKGKSSQAWSTVHQDRDTLQKAQHQIKGMGETRPQDAPNSVLKKKDLAGIPWRTALALQADGWYLRIDNVWSKDNPMPESVTDRPTKAHEYVFLLGKSPHYYYDMLAIAEPSVHPNDNRKARAKTTHKRMPTEMVAGIRPGSATYPTRNRRSVWRIAVSGYGGNHYATFPPDLPELCIKASTSEYGCCPECGAPWRRIVSKNLVPTRKAARTFVVDARDLAADKNDQGSNRQKDGHKSGYRRADTTIGWKPACQCPANEPIPCVVLDPFGGAGTTGLVADRLGRDAILIELNEEYAGDARRRIAADAGMFAEVDVLPAAEITQGSLF